MASASEDVESRGQRMYFCTLDPEDHRVALSSLEERYRDVEVIKLEPQFLRRYNTTFAAPCIIVLCHFFDGRTLLTDADGMYNAFLGAAQAASDGNVFVALTGVSGTRDADQLARDDVVDQLVGAGQASIAQIHRVQRFLTWDDRPSTAQIDHVGRGDVPPLHLLLGNQRSKPPGLLRCNLL